MSEIHPDVKAFTEALWVQIYQRAEKCTGVEFAHALYKITDELWDAGVDDAFESLHIKDFDTAGEAFNITWLTALAIKLSRP